MIKSKRWILGFFLIVLIGVGGYMYTAYRINPLGFFTTEQGKEYYYSSDSARAIKLKYLHQHRDEYDAVIMGGSKTGQFSVDPLSEYTGLRYYNLYFNHGNFKDYLDYTPFLIEDVGIKELTLSLSSYEVNMYDRTQQGTNYETPAITTGSKAKQFLETLKYLVSDRRSLAKYARKNKKRAEAGQYFADCVVDGERNRRKTIMAYHEDPDLFVQTQVMIDYNNRLAALFSGYALDEKIDNMQQNIEALRQIKQMCDSAGVTLKVLITPACFNERHLYEGEEFYTYIRDIIKITGELWDFSNFCDINLNPYNFLDSRHFNNEVADLVVDTMYGVRSCDGFGVLLNKDNIDEYITQRRADYLKYKQEYLTTGTVVLPGKDDPSYLPWRETWEPSRAARDVMEKYWINADPTAAEDETEDPDEGE